MKFSIDETHDEIDEKIKFFFESISVELDSSVKTWRHTLQHWDNLITNAISCFGNYWVFKMIAVIAGGIKSLGEKYSDYDDLNDESKSLCKRVRHARLKSGNKSWWEKQITHAVDLKFILLVFYSWATPKTVQELLPILKPKTGSLAGEELDLLLDGVKRVNSKLRITISQQDQITDIIASPNVPDVIKFLLSTRMSSTRKVDLISNFLKDYKGINKEILDIQMDYFLRLMSEQNADKELLNRIKDCYARMSNNYKKRHSYYYTGNRTKDIIPYNLAREIMEESRKYPRSLVSLAEIACKTFAIQSMKPVGKIASKDKWFENI